MEQTTEQRIGRAQARQIFDAGVKRGETEATAYEWGSSATGSRDADFADAMEEIAADDGSLNQRAFTNMVRSLFNIDGYLLPELTVEHQAQFVRDPVRYFINTDKAQQDAIFREVMKRQSA